MPAVALAVYFSAVLPAARRELGRWRRLAAAIPDPELRRCALAALTGKSANPEAVAVFAILAPRARRRATIAAIVALQVAIDYLDTLGERSGPDPLRNGLRLHRALPAAVTPAAPAEDWYCFNPEREDGGYLAALVSACRQALDALPAAVVVQPRLAAAAWRCGEGQSRTHAAAYGDTSGLERWARGLPVENDYEWWEVAAGASSSVAAHALIAAAADPATSAGRAGRIEAAYFPPIGALTVLLDDLVDRAEDAAAGEHSYLDHYANDAAAAERLGLLAAKAEGTVAGLPSAKRHAAILAGVVGFYLGAAEARAPAAREARRRLLARSGPAAKSIACLTRLRHRLKGNAHRPDPPARA